jgi:hypothetical protein
MKAAGGTRAKSPSRFNRRRQSFNGQAQERDSKIATTGEGSIVSRAGSSVREIVLQYGTATNPHAGNYADWILSLQHAFKEKYPSLAGIFLHAHFEYPTLQRPQRSDRLNELIRESAIRPHPPLEPKPNEDEEDVDEQIWNLYLQRHAAYEMAEVEFREELDMEKRIHVNAVTEFNKEVSKSEQQKPGLYANVRKLISSGSVTVLKRAAGDFETAIDNVSDLTRLLLLARDTHSIAVTQDVISDRNAIYKIWDEIRQTQNETHWTYKQRWDQTRARYSAADGAFRPPEYEAMKFLTSLYQRPLVQTYMTEQANEVRLRNNPDLWPQTVDAAYEAISQFKMITHGSGGGFQTMETAFLAEKRERDKKAAENSVKQKQASGGKAREESTTSRPSTPQRLPTGGGGKSNSSSRPCRFCQMMKNKDFFHLEKDCHLVKDLAAQKEAGDEKEESSLFILSNSGCDQTPSDIVPLNAVTDCFVSTIGLNLSYFFGTNNKLSQFKPRLLKALNSGSVFQPTELILDNGCFLGQRPGIISSPEIADRVYDLDEPSIVSGLGSIEFTQQCDLNVLGTGFYFSLQAPANILAFKYFASRGYMDYVTEEDIFVLTLGSTTLKFVEHERTGLYVCNIQYLLPKAKKAKKHVSYAAQLNNYSDTVEGKLANVSLRERKQFDKVRQFIESTGYHSDKDLVKAISTGVIKNLEFTEQDLARYRSVYGPDLAAVKGKTTSKKAQPVKYEEPKPIPSSINMLQVLVIDLFFVNGIAFLLSKSLQLKYVIVAYLTSKSKPIIWKALTQMIAAYKVRGLSISTIMTDREPAVLALEHDLKATGITLEPTAGESVEEAEREIRTIKEMARSVRFSCPYALCSTIIIYLILFCANSLNNFSRDPSTVQSPNALMSGFQPDAKKMVAFGKYCQVPNSDVDESNKNSVFLDRTRGGITVLSPHSREAITKVFMLDTKTVQSFQAHQVQLLPMPKEVQIHLNNLAGQDEAQKKIKFPQLGLKTTERDLIFEYDNRILEDDECYQLGDDYDIAKDVHVAQIRDSTPDENDLLDIHDIGTPHLIDTPSTSVVINGATEIPEIHGMSPKRVLFEDAPDLPLEIVEPESASDVSPVQTPEEISMLEHVTGLTQPQSIVEAPIMEIEIANAEELELPTSSQFALPPVSKRGGARRKVPSQSVEDAITVGTTERLTRSGRSAVSNYGKGLQNPKFHGLSAYIARTLDLESLGRPDSAFIQMTPVKALRKYPRAALESMTKEITQLCKDKKVFEPINVKTLSKGQLIKIIRSSLFLKEKFYPHGEFEKLKSRLVGGGHMQDRSLYSDDDTSSPTVSVTSILTVAAIAAGEKRHVATIDVPGAYLNAELEPGKEILMRINSLEAAILVNIDSRFEIGLLANGDCVVKLNKALYGLVESALLWHKHITKTLNDLGFIQNPHDQCIYNLMRNGHQCTAAMHVDDLFISSCDKDNLTYLHEGLCKAYGPMDIHHGPKISYVGMTMDFATSGKVSITQEKFIDDVLTDHPVQGTATSPADDHLFSIDESSALLNKDEKEEFHSVSAKLLYLAKRSRPEFLTLTSYLTSRVQCPTHSDNAKLKRGLRYLQGTKDMALSLSAQLPIQITAFVDASFAIHPEMRSHTGAMITIGAGAIYAKSGKQILTTRSSTEAELVGLSDSSVQVIWLRNFLIEQGYDIGPAILCQDNEATIKLAQKGRSTSARTRHISIRYFFIKDRIQTNEIKLKQLPTKEMIADILTKPLQGKQFRDLRNLMLNVDPIASQNFLSWCLTAATVLDLTEDQ